MKTKERNAGESENSNAKIVTGIRALPELKRALIYEARQLGISLSEYGEVILSNRHESKLEAEKLTQLVSQQAQEIEKLKKQTAAICVRQTEILSSEIRDLKKEIAEQNEQLEIYRDERLIYLFEHLKGTTDEVKNAYGDDFKVTYKSTHDVLLAIIYNTKLNK